MKLNIYLGRLRRDTKSRQTAAFGGEINKTEEEHTSNAKKPARPGEGRGNEH